MKIRIYNDLHLEFGFDMRIPKGNICILAGDLVSFNHKELGTRFIEGLTFKFDKIFHIPGNHEYYHGVIPEVDFYWEELAKRLPTYYYMKRKTFELPNVVIIGVTLWTDFNNQNGFSMLYAKNRMNDFRLISKVPGQVFLPQDSVNEHCRDILFLEKEIRKYRNTNHTKIVVTHHLPHPLCVDEKFKNDPLNPAFITDLGSFIGKHKIDYWIYGHTHHPKQFNLDGTKFINNARGYGHFEKVDGFDIEGATITL